MDALAAAFVWFDYAAVAVFGATGAIAAPSKARLNPSRATAPVALLFMNMFQRSNK